MVSEGSLHQAVFEGVERDDTDASACTESVRARLEKGLEVLELMIDLGPKSQEDSGGRVDSPSPGICVDRPTDEAGELGGRADRMVAAGLDDGRSHAPGAALFAEVAEESGQVLARPSVDDLESGRLFPPVHAHIERPVGFEAEAS